MRNADRDRSGELDRAPACVGASGIADRDVRLARSALALGEPAGSTATEAGASLRRSRPIHRLPGEERGRGELPGGGEVGADRDRKHCCQQADCAK
jgi:hypothetical protein